MEMYNQHDRFAVIPPSLKMGSLEGAGIEYCWNGSQFPRTLWFMLSFPPDHAKWCIHVCAPLSVSDLLDRTILVDVDVESVRIMIHGRHAAGLHHAMVVREVLLGEARLVVAVGQFLAHQLRDPRVRRRRAFGVDAGDDERHGNRVGRTDVVGLWPCAFRSFARGIFAWVWLGFWTVGR